MNRHSWMTLAVCTASIGLFSAACGSSDDGSAASGSTGGAAGSGGTSADGSAGTTSDAGGTGGSQQPPQDASHETATGCWIVHLDLGTECNPCALGACCQEMQACDGDPVCVQTAACMANCGSVDGGPQHDPACVQSCAQQAQDAGVPAAYNPLITCLAGTACSSVCKF